MIVLVFRERIVCSTCNFTY